MDRALDNAIAAARDMAEACRDATGEELKRLRIRAMAMERRRKGEGEQ